MRVMFDTNVFNHLLDGFLPPSRIKADWEIISTHLQLDEIENTDCVQRRAALKVIFGNYVRAEVLTEHVVLGVSRFGKGKWGNKSSPYFPIFRDLEAHKKRRNFANQIDALIATTCIENEYLLVTNDDALRQIAEAHGASVIDISDR